MPLSDIVNVTIVTETASVLQAGFGVPLVLGTHTYNSDLIRFYSSTSDMISDGFTTTDGEYLAVQAILAQNPRPEQVAVGRRTHLPTQRYAITPVVADNTAYTMKVNGQSVTFTSGTSATAADIIGGLKTLIDALTMGTGKTVTTSDQTTYLRVLANTAGSVVPVEVTDPSKLAIVQDHSDGGVAADLAAIQLVDDTWYGVINLFNSAAEVAAVAGWVEGAGKMFFADTQDSGVLGSGSTDIGSTLKTSAYARTALLYHPNPGAFAAGAWAGRCLPLDPGSETWKFKTLSGVPAVTLTATQINNMKAKYVNYYYSLGGKNITAEGVVSANEFIDIIRGRDWMQARLQENIYARLVNAKKIPYTDAGIAVVEAEVRAQIDDGIRVGFLAASPAPTVTVPKASSASANDKAARILKNVSFTATIAGAIHKLVISGTISV